MRSDLDRQLREYGRQMDEKQGPLTVEEILERGGELQVVPGRSSRHQSPSSEPVKNQTLGPGRGLAWAAAAFVVILAMGGLYFAFSGGDGQVVDQRTVPSTTTTTSVQSVWSGPVQDRGTLVHRMATTDPVQGRSTKAAWGVPFEWQDPNDASVGWVDVERVAFSPDNGSWYIELAAKPPLAADLELGMLIAYGLVLETTGDGVADYLVGLDNDTPEPGDFHVWVTDLTTGETDEQVGPPYGYPIEFSHPDEAQPGDFPPGAPATMIFKFLGDPPYGPNPSTLNFYAWTSATRDGEVVAWDYAPDTGWITR
jgi:hypothetical protein